MASSVQTLQRTVSDYKEHIAQISTLHQETLDCFKEIQDINVGQEESELLLPALQLPKFDFADRLPCVLFIGSQNCGKSTLLNTFLNKPKLLPFHENPCTSRIVRVVYSDTNYAKLLDTDMNELRRKSFKEKVPGTFIVLGDNDRQDRLQLNKIVEVRLKHELLECGIEVLDSPGRNENEALDSVVDEFIRKGIVPLIVYVVNGDLHVREKDRTTIRELQDKFPNVSLMFVCSKVDIDKRAQRYDKDEDDDDDEDEDLTDFSNPTAELFQLASEKKKEVFRQLKDSCFLSLEENMETSRNFHGVSARNVQSARKKNEQTYDTQNFDRFHCCILEKLESSLKRDSKKALGILLSAQEMILCTVVNAKNSLSITTNVIPAVCDQALKTELHIFTTTLKLNVRSDAIKDTIRHDLEQLSAGFLDDGENYIPLDSGTMKKEFETIQKTAGIDPAVLKQVRFEELLVTEFTRAIKGSIIDRTFNVLKLSIHSVLREVLSQAVREMIKLTQTLRNPLIGRLVKRIFGSAAESEEDVSNFLKLHMILDGLLESVDFAVSSTLRKEISIPLSEFDVNEVGRNPRPRDPLWRRKVVQSLLSKLQYERVASSVIETCEESLLSLHQRFRDAIANYRAINTILDGQHLGSTLARLRSEHVPRVAELAVRGHSLRYVIERGPPQLGQKFKSTADSEIYLCSSRHWCGKQQESVVKVVKKADVDVQMWNQTMLKCMHSLDINEKLGWCCGYHLQLYGWYFPEPDQLYLVMEKAECDLLTALKRGMSWKRRKEVAVDMAKGLHALHGVEHVYHDVKGENVMLSSDGTAKLHLAKPEKPLEDTKLGLPFHISPDMFENYGKDAASTASDIYAFGSLLWVLCEGSGNSRPEAYSQCQDIEAVKFAVCNQGIKPERPPETPDAWWNLMTRCWSDEDLNINGVLNMLLDIDTP